MLRQCNNRVLVDAKCDKLPNNNQHACKNKTTTHQNTTITTVGAVVLRPQTAGLVNAGGSKAIGLVGFTATDGEW